MVDNMIRLFPPTETKFDTNGLGSLVDAVSCIVKEERNGGYELEMKYPVTGIHFKDIKYRSLIFCKPNPTTNPQPFRVYGFSKPINGIVTVNAEHISYDLSGYPVEPFNANSAYNALNGMKLHCPINCPFIFESDRLTNSSFENKKIASMRKLLAGEEGSILDAFGGEYEFDMFTVRLHSSRGQNRGAVIKYGKNLTDITQDEKCSNVYTGIYPYWYSDNYSENGESDGQSLLITLPEKIVYAQGTFDHKKILSLDVSSNFQDPPTEEQLRVYTTRYMSENNIGVPEISLKISFVPMSSMSNLELYSAYDDIRLCDTISIEFELMGIFAEAKCISTEYDVILGKYVSVEFGDPRTKISDTIAETITKADTSYVELETSLTRAIKNATNLITGGLGGYVVLHSSTNGSHPDEILVMDTDNINTAQNVWRFNKNGLGHSSNGYNGDYELAMTMDGAIVADRITSGILDGQIIQGGSIPTNSLVDGSEISSTVSKVIQYGYWLQFDQGDALIIGKAGSNSKVRITNDQIEFIDENNSQVARINQDRITIQNGTIARQLRLGGKYAFIPRNNNSLSFKFIDHD